MKPSSKVACAALLLLTSCAAVDMTATPERPYQTHDVSLATHYAAKQLCSCLFVMGMGEDYCRAWTRTEPASAFWSSNAILKRVDAHVFGLWKAGAHFVDDEVGCVLE